MLTIRSLYFLQRYAFFFYSDTFFYTFFAAYRGGVKINKLHNLYIFFYIKNASQLGDQPHSLCAKSGSRIVKFSTTNPIF